MAARRLYDAPNVQLVVLLEQAREEGLSFDEAWERAVRPGRSLVMSNARAVPYGALRWPTDRTDREAWRAVISRTREGYRRAYEFEPPTRQEIALREIADVIGLVSPMMLRSAAQGMGDGPAVASAA